jgi:Tfp pilus assembly protein PilE
MRAFVQRLRERAPARGDDRGATLIYALIFVTVIAILAAAVLSLADANLRTTRAVRDQAAQAAAADGAAQVAINDLRNGTYFGPPASNCFATSALDLQNFYQPPAGSSLSARVECAYDSSLSVRPGATGAGFALLTLPVGAQTGLALKATGSGGMAVHGDVGSTGKTHVDAGRLEITGAFKSASCQIDNGGTISDASGPVTTLSPQCSTPSSGDPNYDLPTGAAPDVNGSWSNCTAGLRTFQPGLYASNQALNALNGNCAMNFFVPGIYWFAFVGLWETRNAKVVAGATAAPPATVDMATACPSPFDNPPAGAGVMFVFGGNARWKLGNGGQAAVCARLSQVSGQPPLAFFGVKSNVVGAAGTVTPPAANSCIRKDKDAPGGGPSAPCATFQTINHSDIKLYLNGATYLPNGWVDVDLRGSANQFITGGLVVRQFQLFSPASATLPEPLSSGPLPGGGPGGARTVVVLNVYVCPTGGSCTGGTLQLKVKLGINDPSGAPQGGQRQITVYSWSVQR